MIKQLLHKMFFSGRIIVKRINDDNVEVNHIFENVYGIKIISNVERVKSVPVETISKLHLVPGKWDRYVHIAVLKERIGEYYFHTVYYFTPNKNMQEVLINDFGNQNAKKMTGLEIANAIVKLIHQNKSFQIDENGRLSENTDYFTSYDKFIFDKFNKVIDEVDVEKYRVFIGTGFVGYPDLNKVFKAKWEGVLWINLNFNDQTSFLKEKFEKATKNRKELEKMVENSRNKPDLYTGINTIFITKDGEIKEDAVVEIFSGLGFSFLEKKYLKDLFITGTPLIVRDFDYYFQVRPEVVRPYVFYTFEKSTIPKVSEVYGKNRYGSFVSFSSFEENNNPHVLVFAPSGSGKSFGIQNMISQILRVDTKKLFYKQQESLRQDVRIRYFDKGFSAELFFKAMRENKLPVELFAAKIDQISYNVCEIEDGSDYELSLQIINTALLELGYSEPIVEYQADKYIEALKEVKNNPDKVALPKEKIGVLSEERFKQLNNVYRELIELGYSDDDYIEDIKEKRFDFLKQPLVHDVIRVLENRKADQTYTEKERRAMEDLVAKLRVIANQQPLSIPTQIPIRGSRITYFEYEFLAESRLFVPVMLAIFKRLIKEDKFNKPEHEKAYYIVDEAHNMFRNPYFDKALRILVREARRFRIATVFLTQEFQEIPREVITNTNTHMFISPQEAETMRMYISGFYQHLGEKFDKESDLYFVYSQIPPRTFCIKYSTGVFSLLLDVDEYKLKLFDSYRKVLELPDGTVLRKSSAGIET